MALTLVHGNYAAPVPPATLIGCPRPSCRYVASAKSEGEAVRALAAHLIHEHFQPPTADPREVA